MRGLKTNADSYPPIFAVVMRRPGATRLLECHAFACEIEEEAVAAAATLYRALLADLDANRRRPRHTNGVGCMSLASAASSVREASPSSRISNRLNLLQSEQALSISSQPVRPPRTKKNSTSSSITEEETGKPIEVQKVPRRKKKNSDIKPEDILEARERKQEPMSKGKLSPVVQSFVSIQKKSNLRISKEEERQNSRNKLYGSMIELENLDKIEVDHSVDRTDKIYDISANGVYERILNRYEKLPMKVRHEKENNPGKQNTPGDIKDSKKKDQDKSHGLYDFNLSGDVLKMQQTYCSRPQPLIYDRIEKPSYKNEENSVYERSNRRGSKERLYEDHFKNAEKIYTLTQEDIYGSRSSKLDQAKIKSSQEDIFFGKSVRNDPYQLIQENSRDSVSVERRRSRDRDEAPSGKRLSRVITMDKPLKKQLSDSSTNLNVPEYSQPKVRKRSRAGSEPPVSRSEDTMKILQESKLKRSQSDVDVDRGDLMTRVELPRRGSFLNPRSARRPNSIKGGTPLGFTELFDEFRNQEGLTSVDDILAAIIGNSSIRSSWISKLKVQYTS